MIRLRIGKEFEGFSKEGLLFYKGGRTYSVVIEYSLESPFEGEAESWIPIEVIDD